MNIHITRSYLDLARAVVDTQVYGDPNAEHSEDVIFGLMSCTYVYSFMALTAFCSSHLHQQWINNDSSLKRKYENCESFEQLMAGPLKELKKALTELANQLGIQPLHKSNPALWRELNELLKKYRDYFIHPNPEHFHHHLENAGNFQWGFPARVASEIIGHFFQTTGTQVPSWVSRGRLTCRGFDYVES